MGLGRIFRQTLGLADSVPPAETVRFPYSRIRSLLRVEEARYEEEPDLNSLAIIAAGGTPTVRGDLGTTRAYYTNPQDVIDIPISAVAPMGVGTYVGVQTLRCSPVIILHEYKANKQETGVNVVMRGRLTGDGEPAVFFAMHGRVDMNGNFTLKRLLLPVFDEYRCLKGVERVPVTDENSRIACAYMLFTRQQMMEGFPVNARGNLERARHPCKKPGQPSL